MRNALISALCGALTGALVCALSIGLGPLPWLSGQMLAPADASQNALMSPTTGTVSGLQLTNTYNNALDSVNTMNSGASAPTNQLSGTPSLGNWWLNTTGNPYPAQVYDGANWLAPFYIDGINHQVLNQVGGGTATLASAATTSLCADPQYFITISGSTTITSFGTGCFTGQAKKITFSGSLTLTYNASSLIVPGAANVTTSAGDTADAIYLGSANWQIVAYQPASGQALVNPAIDVGAIEWTFSPTVPSSKYMWAYGEAVSRTTYAALDTALNPTFSGITATNGSPTLTGFSDTTQICEGYAAIEASFIPGGAEIASCTSTTVTMSVNANASTTGSVQVFPYGNGCGLAASCSSPSSNFNLPDCRGVTFAGRNNMGGTARSDTRALTSTYFGNNPNSLGAFGGTQSQTLVAGNIPQFQFTPSGSIGGSQNSNVFTGGSGSFYGSGGGSFNPGGSITINGSNFTFTGNQITIGNSSPNAFSTLQPTLTVNCMIRVLTMLDVRGLPAVDDNDQLAAIETRRLAA